MKTKEKEMKIKETKETKETRLNTAITAYMTHMKNAMKEKSTALGLEEPAVNELIEHINTFPQFVVTPEILGKRTRAKNPIPLYERCTANRANGEQCTRRKKCDNELCGTHAKGLPHGSSNSASSSSSSSLSLLVLDASASSSASMANNPLRGRKVEVWAQDIQGIIYYLDHAGNVYQPDDIVSNKINPNVIAKYVLTGNVFSIPAFEK